MYLVCTPCRSTPVRQWMCTSQHSTPTCLQCYSTAPKKSPRPVVVASQPASPSQPAKQVAGRASIPLHANTNCPLLLPSHSAKSNPFCEPPPTPNLNFFSLASCWRNLGRI